MRSIEFLKEVMISPDLHFRLCSLFLDLGSESESDDSDDYTAMMEAVLNKVQNPRSESARRALKRIDYLASLEKTSENIMLSRSHRGKFHMAFFGEKGQSVQEFRFEEPENYWPIHEKPDEPGRSPFKFPRGDAMLSVFLVADIVAILNKKGSKVESTTLTIYRSVMKLVLHFMIGMEMIRFEDLNSPGAFFCALTPTVAKQFAEAIRQGYSPHTCDRYMGALGSIFGQGKNDTARRQSIATYLVQDFRDKVLEDLPDRITGGERLEGRIIRARLLDSMDDIHKVFSRYQAKAKKVIANNHDLQKKENPKELLPYAAITRHSRILLGVVTRLHEKLEDSFERSHYNVEIHNLSVKKTDRVVVISDSVSQGQLQAFVSGLEALVMISMCGQRGQVLSKIPFQSFDNANGRCLVTPAIEKTERESGVFILPEKVRVLLQFYYSCVRPTLISRIERKKDKAANKYLESLRGKNRSEIPLFIHTETGLELEPYATTSTFCHWIKDLNADTHMFRKNAEDEFTKEEEKMCNPKHYRISMATGMWKEYRAGKIGKGKSRDEFLGIMATRMNTSVPMLVQYYIQDLSVNMTGSVGTLGDDIDDDLGLGQNPSRFGMRGDDENRERDGYASHNSSEDSSDEIVKRKKSNGKKNTKKAKKASMAAPTVEKKHKRNKKKAKHSTTFSEDPSSEDPSSEDPSSEESPSEHSSDEKKHNRNKRKAELKNKKKKAKKSKRKLFK